MLVFELLGDFLQQMAYLPIGDPIRYTHENVSILISHPPDRFLEASISPDVDDDRLAFWVMDSTLIGIVHSSQ